MYSITGEFDGNDITGLRPPVTESFDHLIFHGSSPLTADFFGADFKFLANGVTNSVNGDENPSNITLNEDGARNN